MRGRERRVVQEAQGDPAGVELRLQPRLLARGGVAGGERVGALKVSGVEQFSRQQATLHPPGVAVLGFGGARNRGEKLCGLGDLVRLARGVDAREQKDGVGAVLRGEFRDRLGQGHSLVERVGGVQQRLAVLAREDRGAARGGGLLAQPQPTQRDRGDPRASARRRTPGQPVFERGGEVFRSATAAARFRARVRPGRAAPARVRRRGWVGGNAAR